MLNRMGTAGRLLLVAGLIIVVHVTSLQVRGMLEPATIDLPDWSLEDFPEELGPWRAHESELDDRIFRKIGADQAKDWITTLPDGREASTHIAVFDNLDEGVWHYPANCYGAAGWRNLETHEAELSADGAASRPVNISTWEQGGRRVKVLYWYQLGEQTIFGRFDLGKARLALAGRETWPPLVKVLLQTSAEDPADAETQLLDLGSRINRWLHNQTTDGSAGGESSQAAPPSQLEADGSEETPAATPSRSNPGGGE